MEKVSLRPEGTAGVIRSIIEKNLIVLQINLVYRPMRYERPQKGRFR